MFEAFIMVCSVYNFMDCRTFKDLNGPYVEMEKCEVRIEEMKFDIINNKLPFVVIKQKCTDQFTNPEKYNGNASKTEKLREKLKI